MPVGIVVHALPGPWQTSSVNGGSPAPERRPVVIRVCPGVIPAYPPPPTLAPIRVLLETRWDRRGATHAGCHGFTLHMPVTGGMGSSLLLAHWCDAADGAAIHPGVRDSSRTGWVHRL